MYLEVRNQFGKRVAPIQIARSVQDLLSHVVNEDTMVSVTVEPERDAIERILKLDAIKRIEIDIRLPNPDIDPEGEAEVWAELDQQGIGEQKMDLAAKLGARVNLNEGNQLKARVAARNGVVRARGLSGGNRVSLATTDYPKEDIVTFIFGANPFKVIIDHFRLK
jgi:hypothetical protein